MTHYGYRDASPWDVLSKPAPTCPIKYVMVTANLLLFTLRSLGPSTPIRIANELNTHRKYTARNLGALFRDGTLDRKKTLASYDGHPRATFLYWIKS